MTLLAAYVLLLGNESVTDLEQVGRARRGETVEAVAEEDKRPWVEQNRRKQEERYDAALPGDGIHMIQKYRSRD